ncbi:G1 family glutamic endopeptidase [Streptomyces sp. NPDC048277]|uniref:G1 family glutamic endopeptidase n=1 Tax=Streptomyces sp. NPDC048277 TaxID=3155027 RepID=UPI00340A9E5B
MLRRMCISLASLVLAAGPADALDGTGNLHSAAALATVKTANWSGYAAVGNYRRADATWVQPAVTCTSGTQYSSVWVGLNGYNSSTVEQIGTEADCSGGTPVYYGWYQYYPDTRHSFSDTVTPGDTMAAFVLYDGNSTYDVAIFDETADWSEVMVQSLPGTPSTSAEVVVGLPPCDSGCIQPLANFGTVSVQQARFNYLPISAANPAQVVMVNGAGQNKDTVSALSSDGTDFSTTWARAD